MKTWLPLLALLAVAKGQSMLHRSCDLIPSPLPNETAS